MKSENQPGCRYLFGPVFSRRLGMSLGIDLVPFKTCSLNCIYCECGSTTNLSNKQKNYVPVEAIISELDNYISQNPKLDVITFAGSGEPTLHSGLGTLISHVKTRYPQYKTAILTNSTLLHKKSVRDAIVSLDYVLPSLDAVSQDIMDIINRPGENVTATQILEGLKDFSLEYKGIIWIEIFIVPGINDTPDELQKFKDYLSGIRFDRIQLNSLDRPGACSWVKPASFNRLNEIADFFKPMPVEIIARSKVSSSGGNTVNNLNEAITAALFRRPCTVNDISVMFGIKEEKALEILEKMHSEKSVEIQEINGNLFYKPFNSIKAE